MPVAPSFLFHGEVFAFGAQLEAPRVRNVKGALALPRVGGELHVEDGPWDLGSLGSFSPQPARVARVTSRAIGEGDATSSRTEVACTMEGLELPGILKAERLSADITSTYSNNRHSFTQEVTLEGLQIDGRAEEYVMNRQVLEAVQGSATLADLRQRMLSDPAVRENFVNAGTNETGGAHTLATRPTDLACYVLEPVLAGGVERMPLQIRKGDTQVDVFVGEYLVAEQRRRLTMLRVEMRPVGAPAAAAAASTQKGSVVVLELVINGHKHP